MAANQIELSEMIAKMKPKARAEALACDLTPQAYPFDAIKRAEEVEKVVMQSDKRLYYKFRVQDFYGGVATADTIGCNIMCAYCWNYGRNLNPCAVTGAKFVGPVEVAARLDKMREKNFGLSGRISGAEPFLGEASTNHIAKVLEACHISNFIIETNGIMLGYQPELIDLLKAERPLIRIALKADNADTFEKITGAKGEAFNYQIEAIKALRKAGIRHDIAAMPEFCNKRTLERLAGNKSIELENLRYYASTKRNLKARGL